MPDVKISALPAATTPLAGTELLELVQGGANKKVAASAFAAAAGGGGTVKVYNVKTDYGAVGDGAADDTTKIQAAIDAAEATVADLAGVLADGDYAGGGIVYLPPGRYKITATLTINKSNIWLVGDGPASRIVGGGAFRMLLVQGVTGDASQWLRRVAVKGLTFDGQSGSTGAIAFDSALENLVEDCFVYRCNGPGIETVNLAFVTTIRRCTIRRCATGITLGPWSNNIVITQCRIQHNSSHAIVTADGGSNNLGGVNITGNDIEGNGGKGLIFGTGQHRGWWITGNYFEANDAAQATPANRRNILIPSTVGVADGIYITGNYFVSGNVGERYPVEIAGGTNMECFNTADNFDASGATCVLVASGLTKIRYSQTMDTAGGAANAAVVFQGDGSPNDFSSALEFRTPGSNYRVMAGRPGIGDSGFAIYHTTVTDGDGNGGIVAIGCAPTTTNDESEAILAFKVAGSWTYQRVVRGAADSAGTGFRQLRVAN